MLNFELQNTKKCVTCFVWFLNGWATSLWRSIRRIPLWIRSATAEKCWEGISTSVHFKTLLNTQYLHKYQPFPALVFHCCNQTPEILQGKKTFIGSWFRGASPQSGSPLFWTRTETTYQGSDKVWATSWLTESKGELGRGQGQGIPFKAQP